MSSMSIGKIAKATGLGVATIRYYEKEGLIDEPPRKESGYRMYPDDTVKRIKFIKKAKDLGFSLKEILELLKLQIDDKATCEDVRLRTESKLASIDEKIQALQRIKSVLLNLTDECSNKGPITECPILEALESED